MTTKLDIQDHFCGAGGSSQGMEDAGFEIVAAANHSELAIRTHSANFPGTKHFCVDLSVTHPKHLPHTAAMWSSPECDGHTQANGDERWLQPDLFGESVPDDVALRSRETAWDVVRASEYHRFRLVIVENVVEFRKWILWDSWLHAMQTLGYSFKAVYMNSMFVGAPQSRDRMYTVFWRGNKAPDLEFRPRGRCAACDQEVECVQAWKKPQFPWGRYKRQYIYVCPRCTREVIPYYSGAWTVIDWDLPCPRIGDRKQLKLRKLKDTTIERIKLGLVKYGNVAFTVETAFGGKKQGNIRRVTTCDHTWNITQPFATQTSRQTMALAVPAAFQVIFKANGTLKPVTEPFTTLHADGNDHGLLLPFVMAYHNNPVFAPVDHPLPTVTSVDRNALILPDVDRVIEDCGFRMIAPRECFAAMAFRPNYTVFGNQREQVCQAGNAVTPVSARWLGERCRDVFC